MTAKILGPVGMKAFEARGIDAETVVRFGIHTARRNEAGEVVPDEGGNIVVFPFDEHGVTVNEKYRAPGKKFWQRQGGRRTFWNSDALDDPALADGRMALVITEGEIDALTAIDCGFPLTVSVPDGAPPATESNSPAKFDPKADASGKFEFLWNNRDRLARVKRFIIAVDNDAPGQRLADELVRRLSASRCLFVTYPKGCKDLNDVLVRDGPEAVSAVLNAAQHYPVKGIYRLDEYPERGAIETFATGWQTVDELLKLFTPAFIVATGIPSHGKSTFLTNLAVNLAELHGWRTAIFSPEMPVIPHQRDKMRRIAGRAAVDQMKPARLGQIDRWISEYFVFIDHDSDSDEDITLEWLMERAADCVLRYGIRALIIDPWNEIEHAKTRDESMTEYTGRAIRALKKFANRYNLAIFVVVHPTKDVGKDGKSRVPTLYDADGSAHWFNKPDLGLIIDRPDPKVDETMLYVAKVRFDGTGEKGSVRMKFDRETSRYELLDFDSHPDMLA